MLQLNFHQLDTAFGDEVCEDCEVVSQQVPAAQHESFRGMQAGAFVEAINLSFCALKSETAANRIM